MDSKRKRVTPYKRFTYSQNDMQTALEAIQNGMTLGESARTYRIPKSTLHNKVSGKVPNVRKMEPATVLTDDEEERLEKWILGKGKLGFPMHPDQVKDAVQRVLIDAPRDNPFTANRPGPKWFELFLKRHPLIVKRNTEIISKARAAVTEDGLRKWFAETKNFLAGINALDVLERAQSIFNSDETGIHICSKSDLLLGPKHERNFYEIAHESEKESITVLCTFSAAGKSVPPMIVYPFKRIPAHIAESVPNNWPIGRSDTGWMVSSTFFEYIANVFYPWCLENEVVFPVLFFLDGHKSHLSLETCEFCLEHNIILYCLPPNSTHIMQLCDVTIFKPLKLSWRKRVHEYKQNTQKNITKATFAPIFKTAFDEFLNENIIKNGFRACGLYPFDENAVNYSKCMDKSRTDHFNKPDNSLISTNDFATAKTVLEFVIGPKESEIFNNMRNSKKCCSNSLYTFWKKCADCCDGVESADDVQSTIETLNLDTLNVESGIQQVNYVNNNNESLTDGNGPNEVTIEVVNSPFLNIDTNENVDISNMEMTDDIISFPAEEFGSLINAHPESLISNNNSVDGIESVANLPDDSLLAMSLDNDISNESLDKNKHMSLELNETCSKPQLDLKCIWNKHLTWPESENVTTGKIKKERKFPYAITSHKWKKYHIIQREQKLEKLRKAQEKIALRKIKTEAVEIQKKVRAQKKAEKDKMKIQEKENIAKRKRETAELKIKNKQETISKKT